MKKLIAIVVVLSLILCGCGGNESAAAAQPGTPDEVSAGSAADAVSALEETSMGEGPISSEEPEPLTAVPVERQPLETGLQEPGELGRWLYEAQEDANDTSTAYDCDMTQTSVFTSAETTTTTKTSMRVREITLKNRNIMHHQTKTQDGLSLDVWYHDGMVYLSDVTDSIKVPMTQESFLREYSVFHKLEGIDQNSFALLSGEQLDSGYRLHYGQITNEAKAIYTEFYAAQFQETFPYAEFEFLDLTLEGSSILDAYGYPTQCEETLCIAYLYNGTEAQFCITTQITYNSFNENVNITVPKDDQSFRRMNDTAIPEKFTAAYVTPLVYPSLCYEGYTRLSVSDFSSRDVYETYDIGSYISMETGAYMYREHLVEKNVTRTSRNSTLYENGTVTLTEIDDPWGEATEKISSWYSTDKQIYSEFYGDFNRLLPSYEAGSQFKLYTENDVTYLNYQLDSDYAQKMVEDALLEHNIPIYTEEATDIKASGHSDMEFDELGMVCYHDISCTLILTFGDTIFSIIYTDSIYLNEVGDTVTVYTYE